MKAIVLAAGESKRLRPLTSNTPKCLLPIGNSTLLELSLAKLQKYPFDEIIIVTGYLNRQLSFLQEKYPKIRFIQNDEYMKKNNMYSLWLAKEHLSNDFLLLNSDIIFDTKIIELVLSKTDFSNMAIEQKTKQVDEEMKVRIDDHHRILRISKQIPIEQSAGEYIGIMFIHQNNRNRYFAEIERLLALDITDCYYEDALSNVCTQFTLKASLFSDLPIMEIDTLDDYKRAIQLYDDTPIAHL